MIIAFVKGGGLLFSLLANAGYDGRLPKQVRPVGKG
jgi:hypothetical protein